jgi:hypothetical protein
MRVFLDVLVANNGPLASEGILSATEFRASGGVDDSLQLEPSLPVTLALAPGEEEAVTFSTDWTWVNDDYTLSWVFEISDASLLDPVEPNTASGSFAGETEDGDGRGGCFIAAAAYGSSLDPHVERLRLFRDETLLRTPVGRTFASWYYAFSPPVAHHMGQSETLRAVIRAVLAALIFAIEHPYGAILVLTGALFPGVLVVRRKKASRVERMG